MKLLLTSIVLVTLTVLAHSSVNNESIIAAHVPNGNVSEFHVAYNNDSVQPLAPPASAPSYVSSPTPPPPVVQSFNSFPVQQQ